METPKAMITLWGSRVFLLLFAITLQVQVTLFSSAEYQGLRVSSADFLLPFAGLFILGCLVFKKSNWPRWEKPFGYWAPFLLTAVFVYGLVYGYIVQGGINHWAAYNKGIGWLVLCAYLMAGAWVGTNNARDIRRWFVLPFVMFLVIITALDAILRILLYKEVGLGFVFMGHNFGYDLAGLMVNRNAFAFLFLSALVFTSILLLKRSDLSKIETFAFKALWLLLPVFLALNLSRSSMLILVPFVLYLLVVNWRYFARRILPFVLVGLLAVPFTNTGKIVRVGATLTQIEQNYDKATNDDAQKTVPRTYQGDRIRFEVLLHCWELIKQHPITGAGLGSILYFQEGKDPRRISIMDNTLLWILTEMGPIGLLCFLGVYITMLRALFRHEDHQHFSYAIGFMLLGFGIFSLTHEILYSRFLWFFLGLGLAAPALKAHLQQSNSSETIDPEG